VSSVLSRLKGSRSEFPQMSNKEKLRLHYNKLRTIRKFRSKEKALDFLGGKCVKCGSKDKLEFDHINQDRKDAKHCISVMIGSQLRWERIEEELQKCQLLCKSCHWEKTKKDLGQLKYKHGTVTFYRKGCRCDKCRTTHIAYLKDYRRKKLVEML
jgi:5-methylcytosine-specific restriction endonuclease McrA